MVPFTAPPPLSVLARMGLRIMPTAAQLLEAGRKDLVASIKQAGGFLEVAQASRAGWTACRRARGLLAQLGCIGAAGCRLQEC